LAEAEIDVMSRAGHHTPTRSPTYFHRQSPNTITDFGCLLLLVLAMVATQYLLSKLPALIVDGCRALAVCVSTRVDKAFCESERTFTCLLLDAPEWDVIVKRPGLGKKMRPKRKHTPPTRTPPPLSPPLPPLPPPPMMTRRVWVCMRHGSFAHSRDPPWRRSCPWYTAMHHHLEWGIPPRTGEERLHSSGASFRGRGCGPSLSLQRRARVCCVFACALCVPLCIHLTQITLHSMLLICGAYC
jgi:hypothetical protein